MPPTVTISNSFEQIKVTHDERLAEYHKERFSLFSPEQLRACALFVKLCAGDETGFAAAWFAQGLYDDFWRQHDRLPDGSATG